MGTASDSDTPSTADKEKSGGIVLVSSTVYGSEELLNRIYSVLTGRGYTVWMSHKGTLPINSSQAATECCVKMVGECDYFLGLITPKYGSGQAIDAEISVTHREIEQAIQLRTKREKN
jgi:hypothetical protein